MDNKKKKILLVPNCFLTKGFNSNYRDEMEESLKVLLDFETGVMPMPCPHLFAIMNNDVAIHPNESIEKFVSCTPELYTQIANHLLIKIVKFRQLNFEIMGIVGIKDSPVCEVGNNHNTMSFSYSSFMETLKNKLCEQSINIPMVNIVNPKKCRTVY
jgi:hypothetical protein